MKVLNNFDTEANFWIMNPQLKIVFDDFYTKDKSKDKTESSKMMWAVALITDSDSKFDNLPQDDKKDLVAKDYLKNPKFKWAIVKDLVSTYENLILTPAKRALKIWNEKVLERAEFLKKTKYNLGTIGGKGAYVGGTADLIDKMMANTKKLYDDYQRVIKDLEEEEMQEIGKGNRVASLTDSGEI